MSSCEATAPTSSLLYLPGLRRDLCSWVGPKRFSPGSPCRAIQTVDQVMAANAITNATPSTIAATTSGGQPIVQSKTPRSTPHSSQSSPNSLDAAKIINARTAVSEVASIATHQPNCHEALLPMSCRRRAASATLGSKVARMKRFIAESSVPLDVLVPLLKGVQDAMCLMVEHLGGPATRARPTPFVQTTGRNGFHPDCTAFSAVRRTWAPGSTGGREKLRPKRGRGCTHNQRTRG